jgi:hypothetical protein
MSVICNGTCRRYKVTKPTDNGRYMVGQKRCNSCAIFIRWDGIFCPCCNCRLRVSPRNGFLKRKFLDVQSTKKEES